MTRYFFDITENDEKAIDEIGLELPNLCDAEVEAARSLADMARDLSATVDRHALAIEVRTEEGPLFKAAFIYEMVRH